jgi:hypothetical protein
MDENGCWICDSNTAIVSQIHGRPGHEQVGEIQASPEVYKLPRNPHKDAPANLITCQPTDTLEQNFLLAFQLTRSWKHDRSTVHALMRLPRFWRRFRTSDLLAASVLPGSKHASIVLAPSKFTSCCNCLALRAKRRTSVLELCS